MGDFNTYKIGDCLVSGERPIWNSLISLKIIFFFIEFMTNMSTTI